MQNEIQVTELFCGQLKSKTNLKSDNMQNFWGWLRKDIYLLVLWVTLEHAYCASKQ